ncbi:MULTISPECIES: septation protein SepH [unclassified Rhodococcus (in: high G+C Gram-positive bacteria)]|uniref:septation protein SepH n=1 Tax=unclassified Rhodococcus (in: high G+C Gram-positive bacteria) TaxID=192944 RepID=UPI000701A822|nr:MULTISPECIES: septation protein SepH [unclassified Rhodococcus (in: high G+C Gram-positive bacteria)]KQU39638.1 DNA-binding protein [Rhodococcus sp. Leaf225]KQU44075.1 DNA-binding protein [Rhodococcus sp. Leaf258]
MREIHVIGLASDGKHIVCADSSGEKFRLPADEKLRAAARGDAARLGQIEIEMDSLMRPREIQARIRSGASIEQVAKESGMPASKVERYAHPVLLERSRAAELAQLGHPLRADGPAVLTLVEIVGLAFRGRGHSMDQAEWDAWRDEDNHWIAQLTWPAGRTTNTAHWRFQPDAHGGSVTPLDDAASELIDPDFGRQLRGLAPVVAAEEDSPSQQTLDDYYGVDADSDSDTETTAEQPEPPETPAAEPEPEPTQPKPAPGHANAKDKRGKPAMPSWEDVLLGVRSNGR